MIRVFRHYIPSSIIWLIIIESAVFLSSVYIGVEFRFSGPVYKAGDIAESLLGKSLSFMLIMIMSLTAMGLYQRNLISDFATMMIRLFLSFGLGFLLVSLAFYVLPELFIGRGVLAISLVASFFGVIFTRTIFLKVLSNENYKNRVLVIGAGKVASQVDDLKGKIKDSGCSIVGFIPCNEAEIAVDSAQVVSFSDSLFDYAVEQQIDEIVVAVDDRRKKMPLDELLNCKMQGIEVRDIVSFFERITGHLQLDALHPSSMIFSNGFTNAVGFSTSKRLFDVLVSATILLLTSPVIITTYLIIFAGSFGKEPVFYRQQRVGLNNECFDVLKFRSMKTDAEVNGAQYATKNDSRVTKVGKFIRKTRIDELPQLINVLKGEMSFVGPRPERPEFVQGYVDKIPHYAIRHYVKPGITGWAQICYPYGDTEQDAREKLQYDLYYVKNYSLFLDLAILFQTMQVVIFGKGAR